jgi:5-methylcytosine-specific restriction enzyme A
VLFYLEMVDIETKDIVQLIQTDNLLRFYKSREWMSLRLIALRRDNLNVRSARAEKNIGRLNRIREVKDHPELSLSLENLKSLCNTCHNEEHDRLNIWDLNKPKPKFMNEERW